MLRPVAMNSTPIEAMMRPMMRVNTLMPVRPRAIVQPLFCKFPARWS